MTERDLQAFLRKIEQLNQLVSSLESLPERREALRACSDHNQVVALARSWGFAIGRRWGEAGMDDSTAAAQGRNNLLASPCPAAGQERVDVLLRGDSWRLERIHSNQARSGEGFWYDQAEHEWLTLLQGSALLQFADERSARDLSVGDQILISPHRRHRVLRSDPDPGTIWLAVFWTPTG
jgi:cupin 2 domain-containing protein